jgi:protein ImuA
VGELNELSFIDSRRLQLAVERSRVTGFIHRFRPRVQSPVACLTRWKISPLPSQTPDNLPGLGFPRWQVALLKVRNGQPASWQVQWSPKTKSLEYIVLPAIAIEERQTG